MMINKITPGFVCQTFNTETGKYVSQEFVAGAEVEYESESHSLPNNAELANMGFGPEAPNGEPYLPFDMVQPQNN